MFVSIRINTHFVCVGGQHASACVYVYMQYDTHKNWRRGEERVGSAGVKSEGGCTYGNDAFFDFRSTLWGSIHADDGVI